MARPTQNTSHAVMAQRIEAKDSLDDFPTPPWATRALLEHILQPSSLKKLTCLEPACGKGHMAKVLKDYFARVEASDVHAHGYAKVRDFLYPSDATESFDWVITNPPFRLAEEFVHKALNISRAGVAILVRTTFIESVGRFENLFSKKPPSIFAQFTERVPMVKGRLDAKASTATGYCWLVWQIPAIDTPRLVWIPPCRKRLELATDYGHTEEYVSLDLSPNSKRATSKVTKPEARTAKRQVKATQPVKQNDLFGVEDVQSSPTSAKRRS